MRKSRFKDEQIVQILAEVKAGLSPAEVCRKHGVSQHTYYNWRKKFGDLGSSDVRRMKSLEEENGRLKRLVAKQALLLESAQEVISRKW